MSLTTDKIQTLQEVKDDEEGAPDPDAVAYSYSPQAKARTVRALLAAPWPCRAAEVEPLIEVDAIAPKQVGAILAALHKDGLAERERTDEGVFEWRPTAAAFPTDLERQYPPHHIFDSDDDSELPPGSVCRKAVVAWLVVNICPIKQYVRSKEIKGDLEYTSKKIGRCLETLARNTSPPEPVRITEKARSSKSTRYRVEVEVDRER